MTFLLLLHIGSAAACGVARGAVDRSGTAATTTDPSATNQATPVTTTTGTNTNRLWPAPTSAGHSLTAQPEPAACDFQVVPRICGEIGGVYD